MLLGYLFGIKSEPQLVKEIEVNVAYRWFLAMSLGYRSKGRNSINGEPKP